MDFRILGPLEVRSEERTLELGGQKQRELLAVLLVHVGEVVSNDRLIEALWEGDPPDKAVKAVQVYVSHLRKLVGRERLQTRAPGYLLAPQAGELDLHRFEVLRSEGKYREALALWRGPPLSDFQYRGFAQAEITRLDELRLTCLEDRVAGDLASGRHAELVSELAAVVQAHPLRERLQAQYMLALYRSGRQADALEAYRSARAALVDGLGIEPSHGLRELHQQILRQDAELEASPPRARRASRLQAGVGEPPFPLTGLVGRAREVSAIAELLQRAVRLLTLTGPGGTGKTRLAVEIARTVGHRFDEGARFVPLAPLADPTLVLPTILRALGVRQHDGESETDAMRRVLEDASVLLVLDNYEHLLEAAPVASLLASVLPGLTILTTSRAPLHLRGEHLWPVSPLELPVPGSSQAPDDLASVPAIALFVERATALQPGFELDETNATAVAEICVRLDGLPLAIELAAGRVPAVPPAAMTGELDRILPLLSEGPRDAPERQRTLEHTIDWSYGLLTEPERELFRGLSVFSGGWTSEAAATVCDASLHGVGALVETNLIREGGSEDECRFTMLRTIREFARDRVLERGEEGQLARRHADYFLALARRAELRGPDEAAWMKLLELEHDNLRAALGWTLQSGEAELAVQLACALLPFWYTRGYFAEGRQ